MVPGNFGWGSLVFDANTTLAPSFAQRIAIERPMPRDPPVMKTVLPLSVMHRVSGIAVSTSTEQAQGYENPRERRLRYPLHPRRPAPRSDDGRHHDPDLPDVDVRAGRPRRAQRVR